MTRLARIAVIYYSATGNVHRVGCINSARPLNTPACRENRGLTPHAAEALTHPPPFSLSAPNPTLNPGS
jgi:hypothetical protein